MLCYALTMKNRSGFTIVELLIAIVVIVILATISVVAYNGVQDRARNTYLLNDIESIKKTMEMYRGEYGEYPQCAPDTAECTYADIIRPMLVSKYASGLSTTDFAYVHFPGTDSWGMRCLSGTPPYSITYSNNCKFGVQMVGWWYNSAPTCGT